MLSLTNQLLLFFPIFTPFVIYVLPLEKCLLLGYVRGLLPKKLQLVKNVLKAYHYPKIVVT